MAEEQLKIVYVPLTELKPNEYNPKQMTEKEEQDLERSIVEFGIVDPLLANKAKGREGRIIGGHQRYKIYQKLKYKQVPVVWINIPDLKKEQELCLRLSKNTGSWDYNLLANFDEEILIESGFTGDELDEVFGLEMADEFDEQKEFEKAVKNPRGVKTGDVWQLGEHRLIIGDSTDRKNWERLLGEEKFDFIFTDPPYRLAYCKKRVRKVHTKEGWKTKKEREYSSVGETDKKGKKKGFGAKQNREYEGIVQRGVPEYDEWLKYANDFQNPAGANVMIFENWRNVHDLWEAIEKYWKIKNIIIWHLPNRHQGFSAKGRFFNKYDIAPLAGEGVLNQDSEEELEDYLQEKGQKLLDTYQMILYASEGKHTWNKIKGRRYWTIGDHIDWVASSEANTGQNIIFGTKPIQILVPYIKILSPRNGIVMEPFGGSGSTIIACEIMKRNCRAIEISPTYGEVIINRFEKFSAKKAVKA